MKKLLKFFLVILLIVIIFVGRLLINSGFFTKIEPLFKGNSISKIKGFDGAEDIAVDQKTGIAYISSNDFNNAEAKDGGIFAMNLNDKNPKPINLTVGLPFGFFPHGICFFETKEGKKLLFVINHRKEGHFIEIFQTKDSSLVHLESISDPLIIGPNDIVAVAERSFYFTNDHDEPLSNWRAKKDLLQIPMGNVGYFNGKKVQILADGIRYANGINTSLDGKKLFVAAASDQKIIVYDRDLATGAIKETDEIPINGADNIEIDKNDNLWVGCHVKLLAFLAHSKDHSKLSPSEIVKIKYSGKGDYTKESIYLNDGSEISGSTIAVPYKKWLIIGSVFEDFVLLGEMQELGNRQFGNKEMCVKYENDLFLHCIL